MALRAFADGTVFADATGSGPPRVLALHGWGRRGSDFRLVLEDLSALAPDLPGFGASPPPEEPIGARGYARVVAALLDEFDRPPVVLGHSFGGTIAVCLAVSHPDRVGPLVITGSPLLRPTAGRKPSAGYRLARSMNRIGLLSDTRMERMRQRRGSADYRAARGIMRDVFVQAVNESYEPELTSLRAPVSLIWGAEDREVPVAVARGAAALIRSSGGEADLEVLEGIGHMVPLVAPGELRRVVDEALAR